MAEIVTMPKLGFDMAEGTLVRWVVAEGAEITKGAVLAEIETDKATVEVESTFSGIVFKHLIEEKDSVPIGTPIAIISQKGEKIDEKTLLTATPTTEGMALPKKEALPSPRNESPLPALTRPAENPIGDVERISPLARKMAKDAGLDIHKVHGSGPNGRIVKKDIDAALAGFSTSPHVELPKGSPGKMAFEAQNLEWHPQAKPTDMVFPLERLRAAIGRRMGEAKQQIPHFYLTHNFDVDSLMLVREQANLALGDEHKISVNDFIIKATALTLRQFPNLNASLGEGLILQHGNVHIGIATTVPGGLLTVVCKNADQKTIQAISGEVKEMVARARSGKVRPDDIEGSTFSISNLGMYEVEDFVAIINPPEAAILAVATARQVPIVQQNQIKIGWQMKCTLSADHRITDGAEAAQFMQRLGDYLSNPVGLLI